MVHPQNALHPWRVTCRPWRPHWVDSKQCPITKKRVNTRDDILFIANNKGQGFWHVFEEMEQLVIGRLPSSRTVWPGMAMVGIFSNHSKNHTPQTLGLTLWDDVQITIFHSRLSSWLRKKNAAHEIGHHDRGSVLYNSIYLHWRETGLLLFHPKNNQIMTKFLLLPL